MTAQRTFVGFGFGAIQGGLFLYEASRSEAFSRLVVAEIDARLVAALRAAGGAYCVNVAMQDGVRQETVSGVEILNPMDPEERGALMLAVAEADEIATALPSVRAYGSGEPGSVAQVLAGGLERKRRRGGPKAVIYTAENDNHAAEILTERLVGQIGDGWQELAACLNTVIGKMSGTATDPEQIHAQHLRPLAPGLPRAFLVEAFNRILISSVPWSDYRRGIRIFEEKQNLLPFEEAKLYGHNAVHALLGFLLRREGCRMMSSALERPDLMALARTAFLEESGAALCAKYGGMDPLFTREGFRDYAGDLLERMVNPHLQDTVDRVTRQPRRKLEWNDRLIGAMRLALAQNIDPQRFAQGAAAALDALAQEEARRPETLLYTLWPDAGNPAERERIVQLLLEARS